MSIGRTVQMFGVLGGLVGLGFMAFGTVEIGKRVTFVLSVDLDADGYDEVIVGLGATPAEKLPEFESPGDVYVFAFRQGAQVPGLLEEVFACREVVPEELLPGFFQASVAGVGELDGDGLPEVVLVWLEQYWWPTAYCPLAVLQFTGSGYEMIFDTERWVSEIGDYAVVDLDGDGRLEILEIEAVWGKEVREDGTEEPECHWCPHRYSVRVLAFTGSAFVPDPRFNGGEPMVTEEKYKPEIEGSAVGSFLADLIALARSYLK